MAQVSSGWLNKGALPEFNDKRIVLRIGTSVRYLSTKEAADVVYALSWTLNNHGPCAPEK